LSNRALRFSPWRSVQKTETSGSPFSFAGDSPASRDPLHVAHDLVISLGRNDGRGWVASLRSCPEPRLDQRPDHALVARVLKPLALIGHARVIACFLGSSRAASWASICLPFQHAPLSRA
jgi:hypothetical protein